jgi:hypothetical protein
MPGPSASSKLWQCRVCGGSNDGSRELCLQCDCPQESSDSEVERRIEAASTANSIAPVPIKKSVLVAAVAAWLAVLLSGFLLRREVTATDLVAWLILGLGLCYCLARAHGQPAKDGLQNPRPHA